MKGPVVGLALVVAFLSAASVTSADLIIRRGPPPLPGAPAPGASSFTATVNDGLPTNLPDSIQGGFVVLLDNPAGDPLDPANWSDVIQFREVIDVISGNPLSITAHTFSDKDLDLTDSGIDLTVIGITPQDVAVFLAESPTGSTPYIALNADGSSQNVYQLVSDPPEPQVPEPSSFLLVASGLAGLAGVAWRQRRVEPRS